MVGNSKVLNVYGTCLLEEAKTEHRRAPWKTCR